MSGFLFDIGRFGASLLYIAGLFALFIGSGYLTERTYKRFFARPRNPLAPYEDDNRGCLIQAGIFIAWITLLSLLFYPSIDALKRHSCKGERDYEDCVGDEGRYDQSERL